MSYTKTDHRFLCRLVLFAWLCLCLAGWLGGCAMVRGLGEDLSNAATSIEKAMQRPPQYATR